MYLIFVRNSPASAATKKFKISSLSQMFLFYEYLYHIKYYYLIHKTLRRIGSVTKL